MSKKNGPAANNKWQYDPAPESAAHIRLQERYDLFINGKFKQPRLEKYFSTINPANGSHLAGIALAGKADVNDAVNAARKASVGWTKLPAFERGKYIYRIARMIQERARELAVTETLNGGKPIRESRDFDIPAAAAHFFYYAGWADKLEFAFPGRNPRPVGVAGQIIPWNFPLLMAAWKIAPALATGNTVVLKPAETTPLTALKLAEIIRDSDLPPGVVNIITGAGETGQELVGHPGVDKIAFTGSTAVGKKIREQVAGSGKSLILELGGKSANIILDDAPINQAVEGIINAIFFNQGHVCCAGSRLLVQENVAVEVIEKLKHRMSKLITGDPMDKNTDIGAINNEAQLNKINDYLAAAKKEGLGIYQALSTLPSKGFYCNPTLISGVSPGHRFLNEEIFGPVLTVQTFRTIEEAISMANNSQYGLSAGVWSDKGSRILNLTSKLRAGVVWANSFNRFDPASPFGGYKESGFGREGGMHGLKDYLRF
jgi:aldehyde dehydrogenase (NAD+)